MDHGKLLFRGCLLHVRILLSYHMSYFGMQSLHHHKVFFSDVILYINFSRVLHSFNITKKYDIFHIFLRRKNKISFVNSMIEILITSVWSRWGCRRISYWLKALFSIKRRDLKRINFCSLLGYILND